MHRTENNEANPNLHLFKKNEISAARMCKKGCYNVRPTVA